MFLFQEENMNGKQKLDTCKVQHFFSWFLFCMINIITEYRKINFFTSFHNGKQGAAFSGRSGWWH